MNGADDVEKYGKWRNAGPRNRMITMGRPGFTESVKRGAQSVRVAAEDFILGPELPDISSTAARDACAHADIDTALQLLHPAVADFLLRSYGHDGVFIDDKS